MIRGRTGKRKIMLLINTVLYLKIFNPQTKQSWETDGTESLNTSEQGSKILLTNTTFFRIFLVFSKTATLI